MNSIYNYIKSIETKLTQEEAPEIKFLDIELYKKDSFNLKAFSISILQKLSNTSYLLTQLKLTIEKIKNEIVEQINSNFSNYVILISKLQTIDFLIDNINLSLENIKEKLSNEISLVSKYESELKEMLIFIEENDNEIAKVTEMMTKYDNAAKCKRIIDEIDYLQNESGGIAIKSDYTLTRRYLINILRFFDIKSKGVIANDEEINRASVKYNAIIDEIYLYSLDKLFNDTSKGLSKIDLKLIGNRIGLINQIALKKREERKLYQTVYDLYTKSELMTIFDNNNTKNITLSEVIDQIIQLMRKEKYKVLSSEFNSKAFSTLCFLSPFIKKYSNDKLIFNCCDSVLFKANYSSILNFLTFFDIDSHIEVIRQFLQAFSFFTYFQYIQNDIVMKFIDLFKESNENIVVQLGNCVFNYTKTIQDIFVEKKIYLKNVPNFLNFMIQCAILIQSKVDEVNENSEIIKFSKVNEIPYEPDDETKKILNDYSNSLNGYMTYFKQEAFRKSIKEIIDRERLLCKSNEEYQLIINEIDEVIKAIREHIELNI